MATVQVDLMHTSKARNSTRVPSTTEGHITETICYLKDPTSIIKPTLIIQGADSTFEGKQFPDYNYCYIKDFHRYYFITNVTSISALVWQIDCEVDVLATYRKEILATKAFVMYAQQGFNSMIPDSRLPRTDKSATSVLKVPFTPYSRAGIFLLTVVGDNGNGQNGYTATYAMGASQLRSVGAKLNDNGFWETLQKQFVNPLDAVISCIWLPIAGNLIDSTVSEVKIGYSSTGVSGNMISKTYVEGSFSVAIPLHYHDAEGKSYADYRNVEPYTQAYIFLPGCGNVQIPLIRVLKSGSKIPNVSVKYCIDVTTGEIMYTVHDPDDPDGIILTATGGFGVNIPVSSSQGNALGVVTGIGAMIGATVAVAAMPEITIPAALGLGGTVLGGGTSAISSAMQSSTQVSGHISGRSGAYFNDNITVTVTYWEVSDTPSNNTTTIGLPVFKTGTLSTYSGLVKCTGAYVKVECTDDEHHMIAQYVNSSTNFIYGGLIIE